MTNNAKLLKYIESLEIASYLCGWNASQYPDKEAGKKMVKAKNKTIRLNRKIRELLEEK